jgi:transcriptional antiterminator RfaH
MTEVPATVWFCIKTKPRQEAVAERHLRALGEIEILFPRLRRTRRGHSQNKVVLEPLFPSYFFIAFDPTEKQNAVRSTRGVLQLVSRNQQPVVVAPEVIAELRALGPEATLSILDEELKVGGKVRIIRGLFEGTEGEVLRLQTPQARIAVLLNLLGSEQPVEMPLDDVEALKTKDS